MKNQCLKISEIWTGNYESGTIEYFWVFGIKLTSMKKEMFWAHDVKSPTKKSH